MVRKYTEEFLIDELHRFVRENGKVPVALDMHPKFGYPSYNVYKYYFKTWNNALVVAGLKINQTYDYRTGNETCCKCGCSREQSNGWYTKELLKGQVMCKSCYKYFYQKSKSNYKNNDLNKKSSIGSAFISQRVVAKFLNLECRYDCNISEGFDYPYDLYDKDRYGKINVKSSQLYNKIGQNPYWHFHLVQKEIPDTYILVGFDENRKNILHVWITDPLDDLTYDEIKERSKKSISITNTPDNLKQHQSWEVDAIILDNILHKMSQKRKDTEGKDCVLSNDDLSNR